MAVFSSITADVFVSGLLCVLLLGVIGLALRLDARLKTVRDSSGDLHILIKGLNDATERAHQAVAQMSAAAREQKGTLDASIVKARDLSDELTLITQSADSLANRLSGSAGAAAPSPRFSQEDLAPQPRPFSAKDTASSPENMAEQEDNPREMLKKIIAGVR